MIEYQSTKKLVMLRIVPTVITAPTRAKTIYGYREIFSHSEPVFTFATVKFNGQNFIEPISTKSYKCLITQDIIDQLYQIDDDVYAGYLDLGHKGAVVTKEINEAYWNNDLKLGEIIINREATGNHPIVVNEKQFNKTYVWS